jgi:hypothetical protein
MTKHQKSNNSTQIAKQFTVRQMLRSALVVGVVYGFASPALAQSELTLPSFPEDATTLAVPVAQDFSLPPAFIVQKVGPSASQRFASLLGLKKLAPTSPTVNALPAFPSTQPTLLPQPSATEQLSNTSTPSIFRSISSKAGDSQTLHNADLIALASADESLSQIAIPSTLTTQSVDAGAEPSGEESLDISLSELATQTNESLSDTLIDVDIPKNSVDEPAATTQQNLSDVPRVTIQLDQSPVLLQQRAPELVKRSPAMQLHIGANVGAKSTFSDAVQPVSATTNYSMSDAEEDNEEDAVEPEPKTTEAPKAKKTLNVRIEGEPVQVVPRSAAASEAIVTPQKQLSFDPVGLSSGAGSPTVSSPTVSKPTVNLPAVNLPAVSSPAISSPAVSKPTVNLPAVNLPAISSSSTIQSVSSQSVSSQSVSSQSSGAKTPIDKGFDQPPTIGERLEVGLHESINVESKQPISGLSVEHPELCQVLKSGERSLSVVGLKAGQTRVALFTTSTAGERKIEIREVIIAGTENRQADMKSLATEIGKSVRQMYPNSRIEVIAEEDGLAVQGYAGSEAEAKKIIGLIRKTSLQPVVDRLATYK